MGDKCLLFAMAVAQKWGNPKKGQALVNGKWTTPAVHVLMISF